MSRKILYPLLLFLRKKKLPTKTSSRDDELSAKTDLWTRITNQMTPEASSANKFRKQGGCSLEYKPQRFGQSVTYRSAKELKFYKCC